MDHSAAQSVFADYHNRALPPDCSSVLRPSNDDHLLIQPKKLVNPVLESRNHRVMQQELKLNNKLGVDVLNQKSELSRVFQEKKREQVFQERTPKNQPSEFRLAMEKRKKQSEEDKQESNPNVPEFVKIRDQLKRKDDE